MIIKIIDELDKEHTDAGDIVKELREITKDYEIPADLCPIFPILASSNIGLNT